MTSLLKLFLGIKKMSGSINEYLILLHTQFGCYRIVYLKTVYMLYMQTLVTLEFLFIHSANSSVFGMYQIVFWALEGQINPLFTSLIILSKMETFRSLKLFTKSYFWQSSHFLKVYDQDLKSSPSVSLGFTWGVDSS